MNANFRTKVAHFDDLTVGELYQALKLRSDVFVVEQNCVYPDLDDKDRSTGAKHILVYSEAETDSNNLEKNNLEKNNLEHNIIAYARCLAPGVSFEGASIGRVVVEAGARSKGLAKELMLRAVHECQQTWPNVAIQIGAQVYLQRFYELLGFVAFSEPYDEDGIMHIDMQLLPAN